VKIQKVETLQITYNMSTQELEFPIPVLEVEKPRSRKTTVFGREKRYSSREEEDMIIPENSINNYVAPSTSSQSSRSRQISGNPMW
jgi:hypothetical protein